jgi:N-acetyl-anhydromuramyl-L-alanine amidase AmpD
MSKPKTKPKAAKTPARSDNAIIDWAIRFWAPDDGFKTRWSSSKSAPIHQVSCTISQLDDGDFVEIWRVGGINASSVPIQPGLDKLEDNRLYRLDLDLPPASMYRSAGPAGPDTGRANINELPPWFGDYHLYDFQVRPARFWFYVEDLPESADVGAGAKRIREFYDDEVDGAKRPPPALHRLDEDKFGVRHVTVDWRPDWLRRGRRKGGTKAIGPSGGYPIHGGKPTHIVLHATGGAVPPTIGKALGEFMAATSKKGIHYIIDLDGHVVKMCPETHGLAHSNESSWRGKEGLNRRSVGIEHAHGDKQGTYPEAQTRASIDLVRALKRHFDIDGRNIAGHGEVRCITDKEADLSKAIQALEDKTATTKQKQLVADTRAARRKTLEGHDYSEARLEQLVDSYIKGKNLGEYERSWGLALHKNSRLGSCPGLAFEWALFAKRRVVPEPRVEELSDDWDETAYFGVFKLIKGLILKPDDDDAGRKWGGKNHAEPAEEPDSPAQTLGIPAKATPIQELRDDMRTIGYAAPAGGKVDFNEPLKNAIRAFKARYMQKNTLDGNVNAETAKLIKAVVAAYQRGPI